MAGHTQDGKGEILLKLIESSISAAGSSDLRGTVAIGVRETACESWLVASFTDEITIQRSPTLSASVDAMLLMMEADVGRILGAESLDSASTMQVGGDRDLLVAFVERYLLPQPMERSQRKLKKKARVRKMNRSA